jgi:hypothetical protein
MLVNIGFYIQLIVFTCYITALNLWIWLIFAGKIFFFSLGVTFQL